MNETDAKVSAAAEAGDFNPEQKRYLEGFVAGAEAGAFAVRVRLVPRPCRLRSGRDCE